MDWSSERLRQSKQSVKQTRYKRINDNFHRNKNMIHPKGKTTSERNHLSLVILSWYGSSSSQIDRHFKYLILSEVNFPRFSLNWTKNIWQWFVLYLQSWLEIELSITCYLIWLVIALVFKMKIFTMRTLCNSHLKVRTRCYSNVGNKSRGIICFICD